MEIEIEQKLLNKQTLSTEEVSYLASHIKSFTEEQQLLNLWEKVSYSSMENIKLLASLFVEFMKTKPSQYCYFNNLLLNHNGGIVVARGEKINDLEASWVVIKTRKGNLVAYWSTDGIGYNNKLKTEHHTNEFFNFLKEPKNVLPEKIYNELSKRLLISTSE